VKLVYPVYHVIRDLAAHAGCQVLQTVSSTPGAVQALAVDSDEGRRLWMANLTAEDQQVAVEGCADGLVRAARADADGFQQLCRDADAFQAVTETLDPAAVTLGPLRGLSAASVETGAPSPQPLSPHTALTLRRPQSGRLEGFGSKRNHCASCSHLLRDATLRVAPQHEGFRGAFGPFSPGGRPACAKPELRFGEGRRWPEGPDEGVPVPHKSSTTSPRGLAQQMSAWPGSGAARGSSA